MAKSAVRTAEFSEALLAASFRLHFVVRCTNPV
jgi:hypothetical protein